MFLFYGSIKSILSCTQTLTKEISLIHSYSRSCDVSFVDLNFKQRVDGGDQAPGGGGGGQELVTETKLQGRRVSSPETTVQHGDCRW